MDNNETSRFKLQKNYPNNLKDREVLKFIVLFNRKMNYQWFDLIYDRINKNNKNFKTAFLYTFTFHLISHLNSNVKYTVL